MPGWALRIGLVLLLASAGIPHAQSPPAPLVLDTAHSEVALSPHVGYVHDLDGQADLDTARHWKAEGRFQPLPSASAAFGFQRGAFWFHARLVNLHADEPRWLLVQEYALSDRVDVYVLRDDGHRYSKPSPLRVNSTSPNAVMWNRYQK